MLHVEASENEIVKQKHEPFLLLKSRMNANAREVTGNKKFVKLNSTSDGFNEDDDLRNK